MGTDPDWHDAGRQPRKPPPTPNQASLTDTGQDHRLARNTDPQTSHDAIPSPYRLGTVKARLLEVYRRGTPLTAREAAEAARLERGGHKRVSDLKRDGWLQSTGFVRDGGEVLRIIPEHQEGAR